MVIYVNFKILIKIIIITFIVTGVPALIIRPSLNGLNTPFNIPQILFPIVWSILYILMSISYYLVNNKDNTLFMYVLQLFFNTMWTIIFFGLKWRLFAFIWLILLLIIVIKMFIEYFKINKLSGYLLIPYILWIIFAGYLNLTIYLLNR